MSLFSLAFQDVDARNKCGHDDEAVQKLVQILILGQA
jgi:hypothetical protein